MIRYAQTAAALCFRSAAALCFRSAAALCFRSAAALCLWSAAALALTLDPLPGAGQVYAVKAPDFDAAAVPFSGAAPGRDGAIVEIRVLYEGESAPPLMDWTRLGPVQQGAFSGTLDVPRGAQGWAVAEARLIDGAGQPIPGQTARRDTPFAAGYKVILLGQSQLSIAMKSPRIGVTPMAPPRLTFVTNDAGRGWGQTRMLRLGTDHDSDGLMMLANQIRHLGDMTPIMVIDAAVNGTAVGNFLNDDQPARDFMALPAVLDTVGHDVTAVLHQWITSDMRASSYGALHEALLAVPPVMDHSLAQVVEPGFVYVVMPATRHNNVTMSRVRNDSLLWAGRTGHPIGPYLSDLLMDTNGSGTGAHQDADTQMGNPNFGAKLGLGLARAVGLDLSENPYFDRADMSPDKREITVTPVLPNGGQLFSPAPAALSGFETAAPGQTDWQRDGFTARIGPGRRTVLIVRDDGAPFASGTRVRAPSDGRHRPNYDPATESPVWTEAAVIEGSLYETYPGDVMGLGLQVMGTRTAEGLESSDWVAEARLTGLAGPNPALPAGVRVTGGNALGPPYRHVNALGGPADGVSAYVVAQGRIRMDHTPPPSPATIVFAGRGAPDVTADPVPGAAIFRQPGGRRQLVDIQTGTPGRASRDVINVYGKGSIEHLVAFALGQGFAPERAIGAASAETDGDGRIRVVLENVPDGSLIVASALRNDAMEIAWTGLSPVLDTARAGYRGGDRVLSVAAGQGGGNLEIVVRADLLAVAAIPPR